jgi:hypothetical protein
VFFSETSPINEYSFIRVFRGPNAFGRINLLTLSRPGTAHQW